MGFLCLSSQIEVRSLPIISGIQIQKGLGTQVNLNRTFDPQKDGKAEHTIQSLEDMLRSCVINFKGSSDDHLPFI